MGELVGEEVVDWVAEAEEEVAVGVVKPTP